MPSRSKSASREKKRKAASVLVAEERRASPPWLGGIRDPVVVVLKAPSEGGQVPCQVFGVDPGERKLIFTAEGMVPGLVEQLVPDPKKAMVLVIDVAGLLPMGPREDRPNPSPTRPSMGPDEGSLPGDPPPIRPGDGAY